MINFKKLTSRFMGLRNKPRTSRSRWRKTLDRKYRPHEVLEANRRSPFISVRFHWRSEEEKRQTEERIAMFNLAMGTVGVVPGMITGLKEGA